MPSAAVAAAGFLWISLDALPRQIPYAGVDLGLVWISVDPVETEGVGFEPTDPCGSPVFKTGAINHSTTPPGGALR